MNLERGVSLRDGRGAGRYKYPWAQMQIGDSFRADVPADTLRASAHRYAKRHGVRFIVRTEGEGSRAYRVEPHAR
jgi:hypothetical protein